MARIEELLVLAAIGGVSLACVGFGVRSLAGEIRLVRRLGDLGAEDASGRMVEAVRRFGQLALVGGGKDRAEIEQALFAAGYYSPDGPVIFGWARIGGIVGAWIAVALAVALSGHWSGVGPYLPWAAAGIAFLAAKRVLGWNASRRRRKVSAELPFVLDVLSMMLESGVSLDQCFRTLASADGRATPITKQSLQALVQDIERGMAYGAALDRWAARLGVPGASELASLFKRNLAHGSELSSALLAFIREFSDKRVANAREAVGRKAAQLAVAMMIFFMPALFVILAGPAVASLLNALSGLSQ